MLLRLKLPTLLQKYWEKLKKYRLKYVKKSETEMAKTYIFELDDCHLFQVKLAGLKNKKIRILT